MCNINLDPEGPATGMILKAHHLFKNSMCIIPEEGVSEYISILIETYFMIDLKDSKSVSDKLLLELLKVYALSARYLPGCFKITF